MVYLDRIREYYFSYEGRLNRKAFITRYLIMLAIMFLGKMLITAHAGISFNNIIGTLIIIASGVSIIMLDVRRLHDLSKKWYWVLLMLVPVVNVVFLIYLVLACGCGSENEYGPSKC